MPTYPMRCTACDNKTELVMKISEFTAKEHTCETCKAALVRDFSSSHDITVVDNTGTRKGYFNSKEGHHR